MSEAACIWRDSSENNKRRRDAINDEKLRGLYCEFRIRNKGYSWNRHVDVSRVGFSVSRSQNKGLFKRGSKYPENMRREFNMFWCFQEVLKYYDGLLFFKASHMWTAETEDGPINRRRTSSSSDRYSDAGFRV